MTAEQIIDLAIKTGIGAAFGFTILIMWYRWMRTEKENDNKRENKLVEIAERAAVAAERHALVTEKLGNEVIKITERLGKWDVEQLRIAHTLLEAIRDNAIKK